MNSEYEGLRDEIKSWGDRRFTVLAGSIGLVTGILGLKVVGESDASSNWTVVSSSLLSMLAASCAITWYAAQATGKVAAYLMVFHESTQPGSKSWESRLNTLKELGADSHHFNLMMVPIYLVLGCLSLAVPWLSHLQYPLSVWD